MLRSFHIFLLMAFMFVLPHAVHAAEDELKVSDVAAFLNVREQLTPLDDKLVALGTPSFFRPRALNMVGMGVPAHLKNAEMLKEKHPDLYQEFSAVATSYVHENQYKPYASLEDWCKMADRVMLAFYAYKSDNDYDRQPGTELKKALPPGVLALLDDETKQLVQGMDDMYASFEGVSDHDKLVVQQFEQHIGLLFVGMDVKNKGEYVVTE